MSLALGLILYLAVALGVAAELVDRQRALQRALILGAAWPFFAGFALGGAIVKAAER